MKIISDYEKKANIRLSPKVKSQLKSDIRMFVGMKKRRDKKPNSNIEMLLNPNFNLATFFRILCDSKEEYAKCAEAVIIYDLSYEEDVNGMINGLGLCTYYESLKRELIQYLCKNGEIGEELCYELIRKHVAPEIRY